MLLKSLMELTKASIHHGHPYLSFGLFCILFVGGLLTAIQVALVMIASCPCLMPVASSTQVMSVNYGIRLCPTQTVVFIPMYQV